MALYNKGPFVHEAQVSRHHAEAEMMADELKIGTNISDGYCKKALFGLEIAPWEDEEGLMAESLNVCLRAHSSSNSVKYSVRSASVKTGRL